MDWIALLVIAYFLISLTGLTDKFILTKALPHPVVYVFIVSVLGLMAVVLIPFGFGVPDRVTLAVSALAGIGYTSALFFLYQALQRSEASRVFPTAGALGAVLTFIFSYIFLAERLSLTQAIGFAILIVGGIAISWERRSQDQPSGFGYAALAALAFGVSYTATKFVYSHHLFTSGFVWIRLWAFVAIVPVLLISPYRRLIFGAGSSKAPMRKRSNQIIILAGQISSGFGFLLLNYVISLKSATIVLAAQGLQYGFLFILTTLLTIFAPRVLREQLTQPVVIQKGIALLIIALGLGLVARGTV